jgi:D-3-phosphoglycerate dehydrogenase
LGELGIQLMNINEVLSRSDFVSIHVPLKESTRKLIDAKVLTHIKQGAFLINLARGGVVDEIALYDALMEKRLRGAALDVHESEGNGKISPLAGLPNVILTPHIGAGTFDSQREIGEIVLIGSCSVTRILESILRRLIIW